MSAKPGRRSFIKFFGAALGATISAPIAPQLLGATEPVAAGDSWNTLRALWLELGALNEEKVRGWDYEEEREIRETWIKRHSEALDALVSQEQLTDEVAAQLTLAYREALDHAVMIHSGTSCYEPPPPDYVLVMRSRSELYEQQELLEKLAAEGTIDPETLKLSQKALTRDLIILDSLAGKYGQPNEALDELSALFEAESFDAPPEAINAAQILVKLLSQKK